MSDYGRRKFLKLSAAGLAGTLWAPLIQRALAVEAFDATRSIQDVKHVVILMQENRSFDHYFGAKKGARGFGDRFPIPLASGQRVFHQSDGEKIVPPYRAFGKTPNAPMVKGTPHDFADMQAAWNQGKYGYWPLFKTPYSMAYYTREEIPFQYALAEAFTISDAHHCSVATGTDPNRIMFWSGSNFDPEKRAAGINCTDVDSEPCNVRCWVTGKEPDPGYTYQLNGFKWPTIPDVLQEAGISWKIYQDPNNNWTGAMHGCLAFDSFRNAKQGSEIYEKGMRNFSIKDLQRDVENNQLPEVSWILPSRNDSEHPSGPSSPYRAGYFTQQVLEALTSNPEVWSKTVFFLTFDENDGLYDHLPAPAVPSYNLDNTLAGKSTIPVKGMYFNNDKGTEQFLLHDGKSKRIYQDKRDTISGPIRPWGMGPRVPLYIISPWSKGGWIHSEVADHTSVASFIEKRFGVTVPAISPWHRAVSSDLTSAFNFESPNDPAFPKLPDMSDFQQRDDASNQLPKAAPPEQPAQLFQEKGSVFSRALPYALYCHARPMSDKVQIQLVFDNQGKKGAVYHVYDMNNLERIPRRYTVEAGKQIQDEWDLAEKSGQYHLEVFGPNGYFQSFKGSVLSEEPLLRIEYDHREGGLHIHCENGGKDSIQVEVTDNTYGYGPSETLSIPLKKSKKTYQQLSKSGNWYDYSITTSAGMEYRFAGRVETAKPSITDPAMAQHLG
ncbi:phosphocholine-specific phospholipase C [Algoriphagus sp. A40]|uniref:phosphocholine-specific phospholipase C n=1 Tax=Algoriphagus sp. A40 TaxID=1945863 RepID=UPI000984BF19|nr:phospholipase C, phosphocholine-specific [Algoriphagus sp. A40]OOG77893.1 phospholipase C, phosphocholine-specific [Algoriphagus sp. A40]